MPLNRFRVLEVFSLSRLVFNEAHHGQMRTNLQNKAGDGYSSLGFNGEKFFTTAGKYRIISVTTLLD